MGFIFPEEALLIVNANVSAAGGTYSFELLSETSFENAIYSNSVQKIPLVFGGVFLKGEDSAQASTTPFSIQCTGRLEDVEQLNADLNDPKYTGLFLSTITLLNKERKVVITYLAYKKSLQESEDRVNVIIKGYALSDEVTAGQSDFSRLPGSNFTFS
jgi:hypothetical protein